MDINYTRFLDALQRPGSGLSSLPVQQIFAAMSHYLSILPSQHIKSFVHTIVGSPTLWADTRLVFKHRAEDLPTTFRRAAHLRLSQTKTALAAKPLPLFSFHRTSTKIREAMDQWVHSVLQAIQSASRDTDARVRLSVLYGLLLALDDVEEEQIFSKRWRGRVEDEVVVLCAELFEHLRPESGKPSTSQITWVGQFKPTLKDEPLALYTVSHVLPLVPEVKLYALQLEAVIRTCLTTISRCFMRGKFLDDLEKSIEQKSGIIYIDPGCDLSRRFQELTTDPLFGSMSFISRLLSRSLSLLNESRRGQLIAGQPSIARLWEIILETVTTLTSISANINIGWSRSPALAAATTDEDIDAASRATTTEMWRILKTFLFSNVQVFQAVLGVLSSHDSPLSLEDTADVGPSLSSHRNVTSKLAGSVLLALYELSFISSKFGSITAPGAGFSEHKRAFFTTLDILNSDPTASQDVVERLASKIQDVEPGEAHPSQLDRHAFFLACAEQLIGNLTDKCIETQVLPVVQLHLSDTKRRETFELSHSVMLAIFDNNSKKVEDGFLAQRLTPFYREILLKNSHEGQLDTEQFCLAYSNLTRSANLTSDDLAWHCVEGLLSSLVQAKSTPEPDAKRLYRLRLALISLVRSVSLTLLPQLLHHVREEIVQDAGQAELWKAVTDEVLGSLDDSEKEVGMRWLVAAQGLPAGGPEPGIEL